MDVNSRTKLGRELNQIEERKNRDKSMKVKADSLRRPIKYINLKPV